MSFETGIAKILLATFVLWLGLAAFNMLGQRKLFFEKGREELYDFWMPKMCLAEDYADNGVKASAWYETPEGRRFFTARHDKIYPAFALLPLKLFPATRSGACRARFPAPRFGRGVLRRMASPLFSAGWRHAPRCGQHVLLWCALPPALHFPRFLRFLRPYSINHSASAHFPRPLLQPNPRQPRLTYFDDAFAFQLSILAAEAANMI